jgi:hypothetical protein
VDRRHLACTIPLLLLVASPGCSGNQESLQLADLNAAERRYVERFVVLERARAVAMVDAETGPALLDSLAAAWGDSALAETRRGLSRRPLRMAAVQDLLVRILDAERDSLLQAPEPRRLTAPLPDPPPAPSGDADRS